MTHIIIATHINIFYFNLWFLGKTSVQYFLGIDVDIAGSKYANSGAWIVFHSTDHGLAAIEKRGSALSPGTFTNIGLERKIVIFF